MAGETQARRLIARMRESFPNAETHIEPALIARMRNHPKDRHTVDQVLARLARHALRFASRMRIHLNLSSP